MLRASLSRAGCRCGSTARWPRRRSTISAATIATGSCRLATSTSPRARTVSTPRRRSSAWPRSPTLSRIAPRRRRRGTRCRASRRARISPRRSCRACADAARDERLRARHRSDGRLALGDLFAAVRVGHERLAGRSALRGRSDARRLARIERPRDEIEEARLQAVITEAEPAEIADEPRGLRGAIDVAEQPELELPILIAGLIRRAPREDERRASVGGRTDAFDDPVERQIRATSGGEVNAVTESVDDHAHIAPILVAAGLAPHPVEIHAAPGRRERDRRVVTGNHIEGTISFANDELFAKPGLASASSNECEPSVVGPPRP